MFSASVPGDVCRCTAREQRVLWETFFTKLNPLIVRRSTYKDPTTSGQENVQLYYICETEGSVIYFTNDISVITVF